MDPVYSTSLQPASNDSQNVTVSKGQHTPTYIKVSLYNLTQKPVVSSDTRLTVVVQAASR